MLADWCLCKRQACCQWIQSHTEVGSLVSSCHNYRAGLAVYEVSVGQRSVCSCQFLAQQKWWDQQPNCQISAALQCSLSLSLSLTAPSQLRYIFGMNNLKTLKPPARYKWWNPPFLVGVTNYNPSWWLVYPMILIGFILCKIPWKIIPALTFSCATGSCTWKWRSGCPSPKGPGWLRELSKQLANFWNDLSEIPGKMPSNLQSYEFRLVWFILYIYIYIYSSFWGHFDLNFHHSYGKLYSRAGSKSHLSGISSHGVLNKSKRWTGLLKLSEGLRTHEICCRCDRVVMWFTCD